MKVIVVVVSVLTYICMVEPYHVTVAAHQSFPEQYWDTPTTTGELLTINFS